MRGCPSISRKLELVLSALLPLSTKVSAETAELLIDISYTTFSLQVQHFPCFLSFASIEYSTLPGSSDGRVNLLIHPLI